MNEECVCYYCARLKVEFVYIAHQFAPTLIKQSFLTKCDVNVAGYLAKCCVRVTDPDANEFHGDPKKERSQAKSISSHLGLTSLVNKEDSLSCGKQFFQPG